MIFVAWQECFDESTGYPYYWNVESNQVTWEMPPEYKEWLEKTSTKASTKNLETPEVISNNSMVVEKESETSLEVINELPKKSESVEINLDKSKLSASERLKLNRKNKKIEKTRKASTDSDDEYV